MRRLLYISIITVFFAGGCGYIEEAVFIGQNSGPGDFFDESWQYRQPVIIDNSSNPSDLTFYQTKLAITNANTDFWSGVETDARSVRFTDSDKSTLLEFWIELFDFSGQAASFWINVPFIPASSQKTVYIYYGNTSSSAEGDGNTTFIFFDDCEDNDVSDWSILGSGGVSSEPDPGPPVGSTSSYSIKKISNSDPNGGYRSIGTTLDTSGSGYIFEGRILRPDPYGGGASDRLAIESSSYNGYGFNVNHTSGSNYIAIEERTGGSGSTLGSSVSFNPVENDWYDFHFVLKPVGVFDYFYNDQGGSESVTDITDASVSAFDIVAIRGGYEYYVDDMRIRVYTDPEPSATTGAQESQ